MYFPLIKQFFDLNLLRMTDVNWVIFSIMELIWLMHFVIAGAAFISIYFLHVPFPLIVLAAAIAGLLGMRFLPGTFVAAPKTKEPDKKTEGSDENDKNKVLPLVFDDDHAPPAHTLPNKIRTFKILAFDLVLWLAQFLALVIWRGWDSLHAQEYPVFHDRRASYLQRSLRGAGIRHASFDRRSL